MASPLGLLRGSSGLFDEDEVTRIFEDVSPAVVEIEVFGQFGNLQFPSFGSGFLIDNEGHIVTNHHVVSTGSEIVVRFADGRETEAERLGFSEADDLAVIRVDPSIVTEIVPLEFADSSKVEPGQMAIAVGTPFREFNSIGVGVVSGTGRGQTSILNRPIPDMIQTDVPLNSGNSGGPLLNSDGEVIGINSSVRIPFPYGEVGPGEFRIGFAVPSNTAQDLLPQLIESMDVRRPWIGIQGMPVTRGMVDERGFPEGVFVTGVFANSPARRAGLNPFRNFSSDNMGDVITSIDGLSIISVDEMVSYLNAKQPGDEVVLTVYRDGSLRTVTLTLDPWPDGA